MRYSISIPIEGLDDTVNRPTSNTTGRPRERHTISSGLLSDINRSKEKSNLAPPIDNEKYIGDSRSFRLTGSAISAVGIVGSNVIDLVRNDSVTRNLDFVENIVQTTVGGTLGLGGNIVLAQREAARASKQLGKNIIGRIGTAIPGIADDIILTGIITGAELGITQFFTGKRREQEIIYSVKNKNFIERLNGIKIKGNF